MLSSHLWPQPQQYRTVLGTLTVFCQKPELCILHSSALRLSLKPGDFTQPLCPSRKAWKGERVTAICNSPQVMGNRILWIKAPAWRPSDEQSWGTFYRVPQRIPSRSDPWLPRSLTNSVALLVFLSLSHSPCILTLLPRIHLPKKLPTAKFIF